MALVRVFVYGTLRPPRGGTPAADSRFYPHIAPHVRHAVPARLDGADLRDLGEFPGARPGMGTIHGELLTVDPVALEIMDRIEGHPAFFAREQVTVRTGTGDERAWIYWAPAEVVEGKECIEGGDWLRRG